jgi:hypothetical protein
VCTVPGEPPPEVVWIVLPAMTAAEEPVMPAVQPPPPCFVRASATSFAAGANATAPLPSQ